VTQARFRALDGWRGVCAVLVALFHVAAVTELGAGFIIRDAWLFVDFFFVLSGFVITHAETGRLATSAGVGRFVLRRVGRLWPLHVAVLGALIVLEIARAIVQSHFGATEIRPAFTGNHSVGSIFTNLLLIQALGTEKTLTWNVPSWSISTEFYTYLVFAAISFAAAGMRLRTALKFILILVSVTILAKLSPQFMNQTGNLSFFRCLYGFFLGSLVHHAWAMGWGARLTGSLIEIATVALIVIFLSFTEAYPAATMLAPLLFGFGVLVFANESGLLSRLLLTAPLSALGLWSYSIYMIHDFVLGVYFDALAIIDHVLKVHWIVRHDGMAVFDIGSVGRNDLVALAYILTVIALASITWRWIEKPGQQIARKLGGRPVSPEINEKRLAEAAS
jgi:hypothetical protein